MKQKVDAVLIVEKGEQDELGRRFPLAEGVILIGRPFELHQPEIPLKSPFISKNHAQIMYDEGHFVMVDLASSKHGSELNGVLMTKEMPYVLNPNDEISLAKGAVKLRLCFESEMGETLDFTGGVMPFGQPPSAAPDFVVDQDRREVMIRGKQMRPRLGRQEFELLAILHNNRNRAVSKDKIREWVWKGSEDPGVVTDEAIHQLVHRLKRSLNEHASHIIAVHGYYRWDDEVNG